ncbi:hypothetical protein MUK42_03406 [Musa troglodytarum]|uniref:Uncharacterized protein n=1 Tax=Musa troglodytarum TaxID=320322 RepID=A0A9E7KYG8_9LILI|nr:hypothetical protein MUK42_03406 [Musa troglodytarum]
MDCPQSSERGPVVAIECVAGSSKAEEWGGDMLQTGDVVEEIKIGGSPAVHSPFKGGRSGVQKLLHSAFKRGDTSIEVRVRRCGGEAAELQACIVPHSPAGRRQYVLRSIRDPNYAVGFVDRMVSECVALQGSMSSRVVCALSTAKVQDGYVPYNWEKKMKEFLPVPNSSCFLSMLVLPKVLDLVASRYNCLEDTLARANAWLFSSQASGVPIEFMNVQTEALLTKISGETASATVNSGSLSDLSNLANVSLYGFEDYHGVDIGVVRAVRLWYTPAAGELAVNIKLQEGDTKLGFAISCTEEGFIYISSVDDTDDETASTRSGLRDMFRQARNACKLLVISRVSNEKVLPWMVSSAGAIRCFDTISISQKLSLHRHALKPIRIHVLMWEQPSSYEFAEYKAAAPISLPLTPSTADAFETGFERDTAGDVSFRKEHAAFVDQLSDLSEEVLLPAVKSQRFSGMSSAGPDRAGAHNSALRSPSSPFAASMEKFVVPIQSPQQNPKPPLRYALTPLLQSPRPHWKRMIPELEGGVPFCYRRQASQLLLDSLAEVRIFEHNYRTEPGGCPTHAGDFWIRIRHQGSLEDETKDLLHIYTSKALDSVRWNPTNQDEVACASRQHDKVMLFDIGYISSEPVEDVRLPYQRLHLVCGYTTRLLASGLDGAIYIWDKRLSNSPCLELTTNSHSQLNTIALDLEDRVVFGASKQGIIYAWDLRGGRSSYAFQSHNDASCFLLVSLKVSSMLERITTLKAQSNIVSREIHSISFDPSSYHQLAFHLDDGWDGMDISTSSIMRRPSWLPTCSESSLLVVSPRLQTPQSTNSAT